MAVNPGRVIVLMGGFSNERKISLLSGNAALAALKEEGVDARGVDLETGDEKAIEALLRSENPDAVFIALHGRYGEDGRLQHLLERLSIPYTGSGALASAVCFNKHLVKLLLAFFGVPAPSYSLLGRGGSRRFENGGLKFPLVVKPSSGGSAIGMTIAKDRNELDGGIEAAFAEDEKVLVEEYIEGRELTVSVLGNRGISILPIIEIETDEEFYNYRAKYVPGMSRHILPAALGPHDKETVENTARTVYGVLGCRGFARIDMILSGEGVPYVLDVNTIPGLTSTSLFPESARAAGMEMGQLCLKLVELALEA